MPATLPKKDINIALCIITKGDEELATLMKCVESAKDIADQVFITANGSKTDKTEQWCNKNGYHYSYFKWCEDFSAARNFNFERAYEYGEFDYILWLDSDDELVGAKEFREIAKLTKKNGFEVVFLDYWYGCRFEGEPSFHTVKEIDIVQPRERLIAPRSNYWKGRLHETPVPANNKEPRYTKYDYKPQEGRNVVVVHRDMVEDSYIGSAKFERNRKLLELQLEDEKKEGKADPRTLLYLMKIYSELSEPKLWEKVIEFGKEYLDKSGWDEERAVAYDRMGLVLAKMGKTQDAMRCYHEAIAEWPHNPEYYLALAQVYYNLGQYSKAKYWLDIGMNIPSKNPGSTITNYTAMKEMASKLMLNIAFNVDKDIDKAYSAGELLYKVNPSESNANNLAYLEDLKELNDACKHVDKLLEYYDKIGDTLSIVRLLDSLPNAIGAQPFAVRLRNRYTEPKVWGDKEIAYFANFGANHVFKWDGDSLKRGVGGSETAVIKLSEEWTKKGYKVTVYGDPDKPCVINGVTYLPWYYFNVRDQFNIFIQWRNPSLAGKIKAKQFLVDLHDIFAGIDYTPEKLEHIDKVMVKSQYHRSLAPNIPDDKILVVSNGL
jgi:tetratricopeptide (TPR) repeat protein